MMLTILNCRPTHLQPQGQPQEKEDDEAAQETDPVEVLRQQARQRARHVVHREAEGPFGQPGPERGLCPFQVVGMQVIDQLDLVISFQEHGLAQRPENRVEIQRSLHFPVRIQHVKERLEGMGGEIRPETRVNDLVRQVGMGLQESVPAGDAHRLLLLGRQEGAEAGGALDERGDGLIALQRLLRRLPRRHDVHRRRPISRGAHLFQNGETALLLRRHVVDVVHVGVERDAAAEPPEDGGKDKEAGENPFAALRGEVDMPVEVQLEGIPGPGSRRNEHRQEHQHEQDRPHQHHCADEAEIVQGLRLEEEHRQEGAHGGDVAREKRIDLVSKGLALVRLVFQVVHIVERIVHGDADNHGPDPQDDQRDRAFEERNDSKGEQGAGEDGHEDPEDVGEAFVTQPQDDADEESGNRQGQEGVLLDAGGVPHCHLGTAGREDADVRELCRRPRLDSVREVNELRILPGFAAAKGRIEQDDAGTAVCRQEEAVLDAALCRRIERLQPLQDRGEKAQRVAAHILGREGRGHRIEAPLVLRHLFIDKTRGCEERVHARIIRLRQEIGPVRADEIENLRHGAGVCGHLHVRHHAADGSVLAVGGDGNCVDIGPILAEGGHRVQQAVGIFPVGFEENGHPVLAEAIVDVGIALAFLALRKECGNVLLIVHPKRQQRADSQDDGHEENGPSLVRREIVVDMQDELLHRPMSIRG